MKISVITATFNSSGTIRDTVESVLRQTYQDVEYIVVDGKSGDGTVEIVKEYEVRFGGRMKWISEKDMGIYDAMNKGIRMATGDVVGILNSDDFYTSDTVLERVAKAFAETGVDAVYGDIHFVNSNDLTRCVRYYSSRMFSRGQMRFGLMPAHPSFYCKRECYVRYGAFDTSYKIGADFENLLRLIYVYRIKTRYIPMDFVTMRMGGASTSGFASHKQILKDHLKAYKKNGVYSNLLFESLRLPYKLGEMFFFKLLKSV